MAPRCAAGFRAPARHESAIMSPAAMGYVRVPAGAGPRWAEARQAPRAARAKPARVASRTPRVLRGALRVALTRDGLRSCSARPHAALRAARAAPRSSVSSGPQQGRWWPPMAAPMLNAQRHPPRCAGPRRATPWPAKRAPLHGARPKGFFGRVADPFMQRTAIGGPLRGGVPSGTTVLASPSCGGRGWSPEHGAVCRSRPRRVRGPCRSRRVGRCRSGGRRGTTRSPSDRGRGA